MWHRGKGNIGSFWAPGSPMGEWARRWGLEKAQRLWKNREYRIVSLITMLGIQAQGVHFCVHNWFWGSITTIPKELFSRNTVSSPCRLIHTQSSRKDFAKQTAMSYTVWETTARYDSWVCHTNRTFCGQDVKASRCSALGSCSRILPGGPNSALSWAWPWVNGLEEMQCLP